MSRFFFFILISLLSLWKSFDVFADISDETVISHIETCVAARQNGTVGTITDFYCPSGEFSNATGKPFSDPGTLAYEVTVASLFQDADLDTNEKLQTLQNSRAMDMSVWTTTISDFQSDTSSKYHTICQTNPWEGWIYGPRVRNIVNKYLTNHKIWATMDSFPDSVCNQLANKKVNAFENMATIFAFQGIAKWKQNSEDEYMNHIKNQYDTFLDKWNSYKRIFAKAVMKMDSYIRNAVK